MLEACGEYLTCLSLHLADDWFVVAPVNILHPGLRKVMFAKITVIIQASLKGIFLVVALIHIGKKDVFSIYMFVIHWGF